jgi:hypothetical protein
MTLIEALKSYQQADEDGVMVLVSRQACDEAADTISALQAENERLRAGLVRADSEAERGQNGSAAHAQGQLTAVRIILRAALQSTEDDGEPR